MGGGEGEQGREGAGEKGTSGGGKWPVGAQGPAPDAGCTGLAQEMRPM
jgi:hypothetical protein